MFIIRQAKTTEIETIAKLIEKTWKFSYRDILPVYILNKRSYKHSMPHITSDIEANDKTVLVAVSNTNEIIGMVSGGTCREKDGKYDSELYATYVLPEYQGQGVGRSLFLNFCLWLKENNFRSMLLWVLKANVPSRKFYEALGGKFIDEKEFEIDGKSFAVVAYGWLIITSPAAQQ